MNFSDLIEGCVIKRRGRGPRGALRLIAAIRHKLRRVTVLVAADLDAELLEVGDTPQWWLRAVRSLTGGVGLTYVVDDVASTGTLYVHGGWRGEHWYSTHGECGGSRHV